jgi:hypothetical protein
VVKSAHELDEAAAAGGRLVVVELGKDGLLAVSARPPSGEAPVRAAEPRPGDRKPLRPAS